MGNLNLVIIEVDCLSKMFCWKCQVMTYFDFIFFDTYLTISELFLNSSSIYFRQMYFTFTLFMIKKIVICKKGLKWKKYCTSLLLKMLLIFKKKTYVFSPQRNHIFLLRNFIHEWQFPPPFKPIFCVLRVFWLSIMYV